MARVAPPFLTVPSDAVTFVGWSMPDGAQLAEMLPDWDYLTDLVLSAQVDVDLPVALASCCLAGDTPLAWSVSWRNVDGRVGGRASTAPATGAAHLAVVVPGSALGAAVDINIRLVLADKVADPKPGAPHIAGSVLWAYTQRVLLSGDSARFPVEVIDFAAAGLDSDASWTLHVDDLHRPVLGGLRLLLNARDTGLVRAASGTAGGETLAGELHERVATAMIDLAVDHASELDSVDWPDDTIGASLLLLAGRADGGLAALVAAKEASPERYRATVAGLVRRSGIGRRLP